MDLPDNSIPYLTAHWNLPSNVSKRLYHHLDLDARWFPSMDITAAESFNPQLLCDEFMLTDSAVARGQDKCHERLSEDSARKTTTPYTLEVFDTRSRATLSQAAMRMPTLEKIYTGPAPGQIYNLAIVKFKSNQSARLWLSSAIPAGSNYYLNMLRIPLAHAAATQGSALLHSALVEHEGIGTLLPGAAFSGKSTIAAFAMLTGAKLIGDDLILVSTDGESASTARSFRRTLLLRERTHHSLPDSLRAHAKATSVSGTTKYAYDRKKLGRLTGIESKVQRIVLPSISTSLLKNAQYGYQLRRVSKATVVQHLVHSLDSSVLMPGLQSEKTRVTAGLLNLVAGTPCMAVQMDSRFLDAPAQNCQRLLDDIASIPHTVQGVCA